MAGKLCPFAFPKAARNSRSQFSISADFSIRLRGAASHRARAPTRRLLHGESIPSSPPLRKKRKREKRRREKRGALPSLAGSPVHGASRTPSRIEERESSSRRAPDRPSLQNRDGTPSRRNWFVANRLGFPRERRGKERRAYSFAYSIDGSSRFFTHLEDSSSHCPIVLESIEARSKKSRPLPFFGKSWRVWVGRKKTRSTDGTSEPVIPPRDGR